LFVSELNNRINNFEVIALTLPEKEQKLLTIERKYKLNDKLLEGISVEDIDKIKQIKLFNVLPLRSNIIPKNICIDTCALISNFLGYEGTSIHLKNYKKEDNQFKLWNRFLKLDNKIFKKNN
jgi:hypothetical protein